jgi:hypothetical protein
MPKHGKRSSFQAAVSRKIRKNAHEMEQGKLRSGAGSHPRVRKWDQLIAISYSQVRKARHGKH